MCDYTSLLKESLNKLEELKLRHLGPGRGRAGSGMVSWIQQDRRFFAGLSSEFSRKFNRNGFPEG